MITPFEKWLADFESQRDQTGCFEYTAGDMRRAWDAGRESPDDAYALSILASEEVPGE